MNKKILFITVAFPPRLSPASLRISSFAEELERQGHQIFVLTCNQHDDNKFEFKNTISEDKITRIEYFDIFNISRYLPTKFLRKFYYKLISCFISPTGISYPDLRFFFWRKKSFSVCCKLIEKQNIDCVYTSFSPISSLVLGCEIKKKYPEIIWLAEYRDLWTQNHNLSSFRKIISKFELILEKKIVQRADQLITVSNGLSDQLSKSHSRTVEVIYNGTNERKFKETIPHDFIHPTILYCGSIYRKKYDIKPFFEGVKLFLEQTDFSIKINVLFIGQKLPNSWIKLAEKLKISSYIFYEPTQNFESVVSKQLGAKILLLPLWKENNQGIVTSKLFEYLSAKKPILALGNQIETAQLISKYGNGIMSVDPKEISDFISENIKDRNLIVKDISELEKKNQLEKIIKLMSTQS
jgi:glycosyltransferase involved in cell wall biosynthesis